MKLQLFGLSLLVLMLSSCLYILKPNASSAGNTVSSDALAPSNTTVVLFESLSETLAKYERLVKGMTIAQVETILGKADETRKIQITGEPEIHFYTWHSSNGSTINLQFRNNSLISKSQLGLISSQPITF